MICKRCNKRRVFLGDGYKGGINWRCGCNEL